MEQRRKLAVELDAQGIYPPAWTTATRAPWSKQAVYRQTGFHDSAKHFLSHGELYERANNPALTPSPEQAAESLKAYLGQAAKPIHEIIPIDQVPLAHPVGQPMTPDSPEQAAAMAQLLAAQNVNHETWHQGDPVPPAMQKWITANGYKTSDIYQGPDGWHYQRNEKTLESPEMTKLRLAEAMQQSPKDAANTITGASPDPANAKVAEKILADWHKAGAVPVPASSATHPLDGASATAIPASANDNVASPLGTTSPPSSSGSLDDQDNAVTTGASPTNAQRAALETVATALDKLKRNEKIAPQEDALLSGVQQTARANGIGLDFSKLDPDTIRRASGVFNPADPTTHTLLATAATPFPTIGAPAAAAPEAAAVLPEAAAGAGEIVGTALLAPVTAFLYALGVFSNAVAADEDHPAEPNPLSKTKAAEPSVDDLPPPTTPVVPPFPPQIPPKDSSGHSSALPPPPAAPEKVKPLINIIPLSDDTFIKPLILPAWEPIPEFADDRLVRLGSPDLQGRNLECRENMAEFFQDLGYKVIKRFGGPKELDANGKNVNGEYYIPSQTGGVAGSNSIDIGLNVERDGKQYTVLMNSYTFKPGTKLPIKREVDSFLNAIKNSQYRATNGPVGLSDYIQNTYQYYKGAFAMFSKTNPGPEGDAEFQKNCQETFGSMVDGQGNILVHD
jgi:hypothetical protein